MCRILQSQKFFHACELFGSFLEPQCRIIKKKKAEQWGPTVGLEAWANHNLYELSMV